jgi:aspartate aminotransferase
MTDTPVLSDRVQAIKPSPTMAVTQKAAQLRREGRDVIGLGAGEPDFSTPDNIKAAAIAAIEAGKTGYTDVSGIPELKAAICRKFERDNRLQYSPENILVSCGGKHALYNMIMATIGPGDEVIIPAPYWVSYPDMVILAEGTPVILPTSIDSAFKISPEQLESAITDKTRMFIINSPSNPSGMAYSHDELVALGKVLKKYPHIYVATDDMYEHILWTEAPFSNIVNACPELQDRTFVHNGVSKAYAMTGWRIGYVAARPELIKAMSKIQSQSTSNPTSISQWAAVEALDGPQDAVADMLKSFKARHDHVVDRLNNIRGVSAQPGQGTFYVFADVRELARLAGCENDLDLCSLLLEKADVALVPGTAFGTEGYARISFATSMENLDKALDRINRFAQDLA